VEKIVKQAAHVTKKYQVALIPVVAVGIVLLAILAFSLYQNYVLSMTNQRIQKNLASVQSQLKDLKSQDQYKINQDLKDRIKHIEDTYGTSLSLYQKILDLRAQKVNVTDLETTFAASLEFLSKQNYASAAADLTTLAGDITSAQNKLVAATVANLPANIPQSNAAPAAGTLSQQSVTTDTGTFSLSIIAADLNSTKVIVDTASDSDCSNNCPVLPLGSYVSRSGAYAGINGTFFCPTEYPQCAGKTNSFDTLLMNKNKVYFNSANNVYSTVPLVYTNGGEFGVRTSENWGRTTGVDSVIAMQPLLVSGGGIVYGDSSDTKFTNKGTRDFIANKGSTVYIGVIYGANMTDAAHVLHTLGMDNALNLDEGGSTAMMYNGSYIAGPGRNIPNAVLFVRK